MSFGFEPQSVRRRGDPHLHLNVPLDLGLRLVEPTRNLRLMALELPLVLGVEPAVDSGGLGGNGLGDLVLRLVEVGPRQPRDEQTDDGHGHDEAQRPLDRRRRRPLARLAKVPLDRVALGARRAQPPGVPCVPSHARARIRHGEWQGSARLRLDRHPLHQGPIAPHLGDTCPAQRAPRAPRRSACG